MWNPRIAKTFNVIEASKASPSKLAGRQGFEPRLADPETAVLPLDDPPAEPDYRHSMSVVSRSKAII